MAELLQEAFLKPTVIVIGGGLTGLRAALESAKKGVNAIVFSKVHPYEISFSSSSGRDKRCPG